MTNLHLCIEYMKGVGHIEARDGRYLVSFYGRRVTQSYFMTLQAARWGLRQIANDS